MCTKDQTRHYSPSKLINSGQVETLLMVYELSKAIKNLICLFDIFASDRISHFEGFEMVHLALLLAKKSIFCQETFLETYLS